MSSKFPSGILHGDSLRALLNDAKANGYALPAVNCTTSSTVNAALAAAREAQSPIIIQFSHGGAQFFIGKTVKGDNQRGPVLGGIAAAHYVARAALAYEVPVVLHTDHCARKILPWVEGLLAAGEEHFHKEGRPLFSSHMLDLSEEPLEQNLATCAAFLQRMSRLGMTLEIELGVTGGEEDGVDNTGVHEKHLYTTPEEVGRAFERLSAISPDFTVAAAFGNVHGVYKPGNVKLRPTILRDAQNHVHKTFNTPAEKPVRFVFHGGSGSSKEEIREAISYGVVKMNLDTDLQWAYWDGVRSYEAKNRPYLQSQIGNPEGPDAPNKKFYDPRVWLAEAEASFTRRLLESFADLNCIGRNT